MKILFPLLHPRRNQGVALVLVLCFVVLITGLVVAYFSRTLTTRQLTNTSTSTSQADLLANSAADTIVGDLKQEIVNGSLVAMPSPSPSPVGNPVYVPRQAADAVPQRNAAATAPTPAVDPLPNLVRRSLQMDTVSGNANYIRPPALTSRASAANSATPSLNGRYIASYRWNRHYLLPTDPGAAAPPSLQASTPVSNFTSPDWVYVTAEKGPDVLTSPNLDASGTVTATGRYAYAIYDEGGLLDINHTGYPSASLNMSTSPLGPSHIGAKPGPSYADLTQLPLSSTNSTSMTTANVDNLLGWRNYAALEPTGAFPTLQPPSSSATDVAYYNLFASTHYNVSATPAPPAVALPPASILQASSTVWNNGTDQLFLSRQQLINYAAATATDPDPKNHLDPRYLQYLGTFSRSLNQPSYVQEHSTTSLTPPIRPAVVPSNSGGNDAGDDSTNPSTNITPNFLLARVENTFTRFDGTAAVPGEPLMKKRFPLNRLAWLTYKGPSALRNTAATGTSGADGDIGSLKQNGITTEWLDQGTTQNVLTYFGLQWTAPSSPTPGYWTYVHDSGGAILNINNSKKALDVVRSGREPDFFELLKASINPGTLAKASLSSAINSNTQALGAVQQRAMDISLDASILQIGANIIDQFDMDGFPTEIKYNIGNPKLVPPNSGVVYGVENLPYISRVRSGLIRLQEADPPECQPPTGTPDTRPFKNTGLAVLMEYPEIWNPHDWSSNSVNSVGSFGAVGPTNFTIYAATTSNNNVQQTDYVYAGGANGTTSASGISTLSPGFTVPDGFPFGNGSSNPPRGGENRLLSKTNTLMTFTIPFGEGTLFREPTVLFQPNVPADSHLASTALTFSPSNANNLNALGLPQNQQFFSTASGGGLKSAVSGVAASGAPYQKIPSAGSAYVGFYIGGHPLRWKTGGDPKDTTATGSDVASQTFYGPVNDATYYLTCDDGSGNPIIYDTKALTTEGQPNGILNSEVDTCFGLNGVTGPGGAQLDFGLRYFEAVDPRSSRFGLLDSWIQSNQYPIPPNKYTAFGNTLAADDSLLTRRQGTDPGYAMYNAFGGPLYTGNEWFQSSTGWYHSGAADPTSYWCYPGLLSQNLPTTAASGTPTFYYADADGVVRRASGANAMGATGLPMASARGTVNAAYSSASPPNLLSRQMDSRPVILNRPFRSVAELGYVYSGTPWKNLDFFQPESGDAALLDVFCINDNSDTNGLTAGQVNLNTHQVPVLQAVLAGTTKDLWNDTTLHADTAPATIIGSPNATMAHDIAQLLVSRTMQAPTSGPNSSNGPQPLQNVSDLVGRWVSSVPAASGGINGQASCDGFAADLANLTNSGADADPVMHSTQRFAESAVRALSNTGQTRVWNLMFDIVAQTGHFTLQSKKLDQFNVEGEQHYWVHVAIDRYTGQVIDKQVEAVKE